ncbi:class I SAM-dependent methyltransferase [Candidatus Dependentiae bacterium]
MIKDYYTTWKGEEGRLFETPRGILERLRTESILRRFAPKPPAVVYDVGGGAGVYAFPLAQQGYTVHLIDFTPLHIAQAKKKMEETGIKLAECSVGDARNIQADDGIADVVLFFGPLYHLQDKKDREKALSEAHRILKPGGMFFAAAVSSFASYVKFGAEGLLDEPYIASVVERDIKTGKHTNPKNDPRCFTDAYFHSPDELEEEVRDAKFKEVTLFNIQGPASRTEFLEEIVNNEQKLQNFLYFLEMIEHERSIMGATSHMVVMGKK